VRLIRSSQFRAVTKGVGANALETSLQMSLGSSTQA
jgi:hypothetical protein